MNWAGPSSLRLEWPAQTRSNHTTGKLRMEAFSDNPNEPCSPSHTKFSWTEVWPSSTEKGHIATLHLGAIVGHSGFLRYWHRTTTYIYNMCTPPALLAKQAQGSKSMSDTSHELSATGLRGWFKGTWNNRILLCEFGSVLFWQAPLGGMATTMRSVLPGTDKASEFSKRSFPDHQWRSASNARLWQVVF